MKKTLAALAVLGAFSGAAFAQSNVQLYGIVDGGIRMVDSTVDGINSVTGVQSGQQSGSRFGLKGSEQLGNGLKVVFQLENGFDLDSGKLGNDSRLFGREARVGVEGAFGAVNVGRFGNLGSGNGTFSIIGGMASPFGTSFADAGTQGTLLLNDRFDNSVVYVSPKFAGFQASAMYSFQTNGQESAKIDGTTAKPGDTDKNNTYAGLGLTYAIGKLQTGLTYEQFTASYGYLDGFDKDPIAEKNDTKVLKLAANYDFGIVKPFAYYQRGEGGKLADFNLYEGTEAIKSDAFSIGASAPIMGGTLMASYQWFKSDDFKKATDDLNSVNVERQIFAVGYDYPFSKRTNVYGVMSFSQGDGAWDKEKEAVHVTGWDANVNRNVYEIGLRHKF
ncbi:MAG: porin [Burkholderiaceae bacterium]